MKDKHICKQCKCARCNNNDTCLKCQICIDNSLFVDVYDDTDDTCDNFSEMEE